MIQTQVHTHQEGVQQGDQDRPVQGEGADPLPPLRLPRSHEPGHQAAAPHPEEVRQGDVHQHQGKDAEASKKKSLFSRIKKHVDMYENNKDYIAPPSAEAINEAFEAITDEGTGDIQNYDTNTLIYQEGAVENTMYILRSGTVGMYNSDGEKLSELKPVSLFGELGMLANEKREANAVSESDDTYVETITPEYLEPIFLSCPVKIELILKQLSYRLRVLNIDVINTCKEITETYNKK